VLQICWQSLLTRTVWHTELYSFLQRHHYVLIVTEALPLCINRIYGAAWKEALPDESLPVHLIFVLLTWVLISHLKYLDELSHGEPCPLVWRGMILYLEQTVGICCQ
jgi:hypothetical protein